jgi:HAD superfamily hydrolase (TIGR01509 family)
MDTRLVIFDLDGVLVDACDWHRRALNLALEQISNTVIEEKEHYDIFNGIPTKNKLEILVKQGRVDLKDQEEIFVAKQKNTIKIIEACASFRYEKVELLKRLKMEGFKVACFTNSINETAVMMLQKTGIIDLFDSILTNQDVENAKPDPEGYLKTMQIFDCKPENTIIVEDSPKGVAAAKASGAKVIIVKNPEEVNIDMIGKIL